MHLAHHFWKIQFANSVCFSVSFPCPDSWPPTLMVGPSSASPLALLSACNKISLHFQLIWQRRWGTNAYNCHRLVENLINGVFFQVQLHEPSWGLIPLSVNVGICPPIGYQGAKHYFSATSRPLATSESNATHPCDNIRRIKINILGMASSTLNFRGLFIYYVIMAQMYILRQICHENSKRLCNPCLQSTQRN